VLQSYRSRYFGGHDEEPEVEIGDPGETLAEAIERITKERKPSDTLGQQVAYLAKRHQLASEMMKLEHGAATPLKTLEKRVALLQQIDGFGPESSSTDLDQLRNGST